MRNIMIATATMAATPSVVAEEERFFAEVALSSALFDRGEQIGAGSMELSAGLEWLAGDTTLYAGVYGLSQVGADRHAFDNEVDYTIGMSWDGKGYAGDVSANWLTYPNEAEDPSLEIVTAFDLDLPLAPNVAGFLDVHTRDWGVETTFGPEWQSHDWTFYVLGRAGFVSVGGTDGQDRSYAGLESGAAWPISKVAEFGSFVRVDIASDMTFAKTIDATGARRFRNSGLAVGVRFSTVN